MQMFENNQKSVLDLGVGFGFYCTVVRRWLDLGYDGSRRKPVLHGIEGFEKYRNPIWDLYDHIQIGDIKEILNKDRFLYQYEMILLCDVLEHFTKFLQLRKDREDKDKVSLWQEVLSVGGLFGCSKKNEYHLC